MRYGSFFRPVKHKNGCYPLRYPDPIRMGDVDDRRLCASGWLDWLTEIDR